jgi:UDP-N-acetylmuramate dehydrogenase
MIALTPIMVTKIYQVADLKDWTTSGIGPVINYFFLPSSLSEVSEAIDFVRENNLNCMFLGGGSNTIFNENIDPNSAVICLKNMKGIDLDGTTVVIQAGTDLQEVVDFAQTNKLAGIVGLNRVPGTIGGATVGNAGAYGTEMSQLITHVQCLDLSTNTIKTYDNAACQYSYRESLFKHSPNLIVLSVTIELERTTDYSPFVQYLRGLFTFMLPTKHSTYSSLEARYLEIATFRDKIYPKGFRSPGSTFKNIIASQLTQTQINNLPPDSIIVKHDRVPVAKLLETEGSKGMLFGGVSMRPTHANIMMVVGDAKFESAFALVDTLKTKVWDKYGIAIEPEIRLINQFSPLPPTIMSDNNENSSKIEQVTSKQE